MLVVVEWNHPTFQILGVGGDRLLGTCRRCGKCCENLNCEHLKYERVGKVHGEAHEQAVCKIYNKRPIGCFMWPLPTTDIPDGCGFSWGA